MIGDSSEHQLAVTLRLDVDKGRSQDTRTRSRITAFHRRLLQHMLTEAGLLLREGVRMTQPFDANLEKQLILVEQGCMRLAERLISGQRHPIQRIFGEQVIPLVKSLLVDEAGFE